MGGGNDVFSPGKKEQKVVRGELPLSRINGAGFAHLKLLLGWVVYFALFFLTEKLIPAESCHPVHCAADDMIPFCEVFVIPYVLWYLLIAGSLGYFALHNAGSFCRLQRYIMLVQLMAVAAYVLFPTRQDLRPAAFERDNGLSRLVGLIYSVDTNTGVCPSLHVACSIAIASAWCREKGIALPFKGGMVVFCLLICLSTVFIKQHSLLDGAAAIPVCLLAEWWVYHRGGRAVKKPLS